MQASYRCRALIMLSFCMYLSGDLGGVIKDFMADYEGLRSHSKRQGCVLCLIDIVKSHSVSTIELLSVHVIYYSKVQQVLFEVT